MINEMAAYLEMYEKILFGDLRPDKINDNHISKLEEDFISKFFKGDISTLQQLHNEIIKQVDKYLLNAEEKEILNNVESFFRLIFLEELKFNPHYVLKELGTVFYYNSIGKSLFTRELIQPYNKKTIFYFYLIVNEQRIFFNTLTKELENTDSINTQKELIIKSYTKIVHFLKEANRLADTSIVFDSQDKIIPHRLDNYNIYKFLKERLLAIIEELKNSFPTLIEEKEYYDSEYIINVLTNKSTKKLLHETIKGLIFKIELHIDEIKINDHEIIELINLCLENVIKLNKKLDITAEDAKQRTELTLRIKALENFYFLKTHGDQGNYKFIDLITDNITDDIYNSYYNTFKQKIEEFVDPSEILNYLNGEEKAISFTNSLIEMDVSIYLKSIPRRIAQLIIDEKLLHQALLTNSENNNKLKTNLSVPELALLFRLLDDLKPKIFNVKTQTELYRFISANFETKGVKSVNSENSIKNHFLTPNQDVVDFWSKHIFTLISEVKKK